MDSCILKKKERHFRDWVGVECESWKTEGYIWMPHMIAKSINPIKQKVEKCDEIMYIITFYLLFNGQKNLSFSGVNIY